MIILLDVRLKVGLWAEPVMFYAPSCLRHNMLFWTYNVEPIEIKCSIIFTKHQKHVMEQLTVVNGWHWIFILACILKKYVSNVGTFNGSRD